jgi:Family of unknown function (DUF6049)
VSAGADRERPGRTTRSPGTVRRVTTALLLGLLLGLLTVAQGALADPVSAAAGHPVSARPAAAPADQVSVRIESVNPGALTPTATLTLTGRLTNTGTTALNHVYIRLRYRYDALKTRPELQRWAVGDPLLTDSANELQPRRTLTAPLQPGGVVTFAFQVPAKSLRLTERAQDFGSRGLMVDAFADLPPSGTQRVGAAYSFVVWDPVPSQNSTALTVVAPVTSMIPQADASAPTPALLATMATGGRLSRLTETVRTSRMSWAIDPALLDAARRAQNPGATGPSEPATGGTPTTTTTSTTTTPAPSGGAATASGGTTRTPVATSATTTGGGASSATLSAAAASWLADVTGTATVNPPLVLPFGDPDLAALAHYQGTSLLTIARDQGISTAQQVLGPKVRASIAWPVEGRADAPTVDQLRGSAWQGIVLASGTQPPPVTPRAGTVSGRSTVARASGTPLSGLLYDETISGLIARLGTAGIDTADASAIQQRLLAELATITAELPGQTRHLLAVVPRTWDPDPGLVSTVLGTIDEARWVQPQSLDDLLSQAPIARRPGLLYSRQSRTSELPAAVVASATAMESSLAAFSPALTKPDLILPDLRRREVSLVGVAWRGRSAAEQSAARGGLQGQIHAVVTSVTVVTGSDVNVLSHAGRLQVTVRNSLDQTVHVTLVLRPRNGLVRLGTHKPFDVGAQGNATVFFPFRAAGNGAVQVEASLWTSPAGETPIYQAPPFLVRVHSGWETVGLIIAGVLLGVLVLLGLIRSIRRGRNPLPPESAPDPDELLARQESGRRLPRVLGRALRSTSAGSWHPRGTSQAGAAADAPAPADPSNGPSNGRSDGRSGAAPTDEQTGDRPVRRTP